MGRASVTAVGFALADGSSAADTAGFASVTPVPDRFLRRPVCLAPSRANCPRVAWSSPRSPCMRYGETFAATAGTSAEALAAAFAAANAAIMAAREMPSCDRSLGAPVFRVWRNRGCAGWPGNRRRSSIPVASDPRSGRPGQCLPRRRVVARRLHARYVSRRIASAGV